MAEKIQIVTKNTKYSLYDQTEAGFNNTGYNLYGWDTNQNATIPEYAQGATGTFTSSTDLYAIWSKKEVYHVTFNPNGGNGESYRQPFEKDVSKPLYKNIFSHNELPFNGWSESTTGENIYTDGENISISKDTNLYAMWGSDKEEEEEEPTTNDYLTFEPAGDNRVTISMISNGDAPDVKLRYSKDGEHWYDFDVNFTEVTIDPHEKVYIVAKENETNSTFANEGYIYNESSEDHVNNYFEINGKCVASGNINTLINSDNPPDTLTSKCCFAGLFEGCRDLTQAPELPATTLTEGCYQNMFWGCSSLTQAPELPATQITKYCYANMFTFCNLTQAPELPATELVEECYAHMFSSNNNLTSITVHFTDWREDLHPMNRPTYSWFGVSDTVGTHGVFNCPSELPIKRLSILDDGGIPENWIISNIDIQKPDNFLTFEFEEQYNYQHLKLQTNGTPSCEVSLQYSNDGNKWYKMEADRDVYFGGNKNIYIAAGKENQTFGQDNTNYYGFRTLGKKYKVIGNINSLLNNQQPPTTLKSDYCFYKLFFAEDGITQAPELPATTLSKHCYGGMFCGCDFLTSAPELPATTLAEGCYETMFGNCRSLTSTPELPATTLDEGCYRSMFTKCTSLTSTPVLSATILAKECYRSMFSECTSLTQAPELPATELANHCYYYMFNGCTSLTQAPELPATTLVEGCYKSMFGGCTNLSLIIVHFKEWYDKIDSTDLWTLMVGETGTFYCPDELEDKRGSDHIPNGWNKETLIK